MTCGLNLGLELEALRRVYRTRDLKDVVHVEDAVSLGVAVLPVLPDGAMRDVLRRVLREKGWEEGADGTLAKSFEDAVATLSADGREITLRVRASADVAVSGRAQVKEPGSEAQAEASAEAAARRAMEKRTEEERARLSEENLRRLAREEPALRREVQESLNRTYREALELRARQLGEVETMQERGDAAGSYEVTVVVKA